MAFSIWMQQILSDKTNYILAGIIGLMAVFYYNLPFFKQNLLYIFILASLSLTTVVSICNKTSLLFFFLILFALLYYKMGAWKGFRNLGLSKIFIIACVWSCTTVGSIFTERHHDQSLSLREVCLPLLGSFCFYFALAIPFDIRDVKRDKISTLPKKIGLKPSKVLGVFMLVVFISVFLSKTQTARLSILVTSIYLGLFILFSKPSRKNAYYVIFVELSPLIGLLVYLLEKNLMNLSPFAS